LVLRASALEHNLTLMAEYCRASGVDIAPHGKTTMAPQLWERQLAAGAWGITAATVDQVRVMRAVGVPRVLLANELVDPVSIAWVAAQLADPAFELTGYVDSHRSVEILDEGLRAAGADRPLPVLVELGVEGGRTGSRSVQEAVDVASRVATADRLRLAGVSGYEGLICQDRSPECVASVAAYLDRLRELAVTMLQAGAFTGVERVIVSAGGSSFFDLVVDRLRDPWPGGADVRVLLRSGCYLTHDAGFYERLSPMPSRNGPRGFRSAIELWAHVVSRPEPELAILGFGKRDVSYDIDLPMPREVRTAAGATSRIAGDLEIRSLNDQHAYGWLRPGVSLEVGDLVRLDISHPCTALDKWRTIPVLDDDDRVVDAISTWF
jgi:D-serine deaminase-like pyridoxal phosphate-dependent protein